MIASFDLPALQVIKFPLAPFIGIVSHINLCSNLILLLLNAPPGAFIIFAKHSACLYFPYLFSLFAP
jgi:hypothetical protein